MILYKFYINKIEVEEPQMWDGIEFSLQRSQNYIGLENVFTETSLTFDALGAKLITNEFILNGFDGHLELKIETYCNNKVDSVINWRINLMFYSEVEGMVTIKASEPGFQTKFKNRLDIKVNLDQLKSIGGTTLFPAPYKTIDLHSKALVKQGRLEFEQYPTVEIRELNNFFNNPSYYFVPAYNKVLSDFDSFVLPTQVTTHVVNSDLDYLKANPIFFSPYGGNYKLTINTNINIKTSNHSTTSYRLVKGKGLFVGESVDTILVTHNQSGIVNFNINVPQKVINIELLPGEAIWILLQTTFSGVVGNSVVKYTITSNLGTSITVEDLQQTVKESTTRAMLIHDVFQRVCEIITDQKGSFKSDFFALKETYPYYQNDGCGGLTMITNGKNIRNMKQKDNSFFPVSMSFQELFKSCDAVWNLGMRIEIDANGKGVIRVEPKAFFFQNSPFLVFDNVSEIKITPAQNYVFKSIEIGYEKWNLNQGGINGIDEFNTVHSYSLPVENPQNSITAKSSFIASGYVIEQTRRIQYDVSPTNDFETDDNNFFICVLRKPTGYKSEKNEHFPVVNNLISPETAYNLRISPLRNLLRWYPYLAATLYYKLKQYPDTKIKFQTGEGNVLMQSRQVDGCADSHINRTIQENNEIGQFDVVVNSELIIPIQVSFDYPIEFNDFSLIRTNSNRSIKISCNEVTYFAGSIESLKYKLGTDGGIGSFVLVGLGRQDAAFDYGFTLSFTS